MTSTLPVLPLSPDEPPAWVLEMRVAQKRLCHGQELRERNARLEELERCINRLVVADIDRSRELAQAKAAAWAAEMGEVELSYYFEAAWNRFSRETQRLALAYISPRVRA
jgi:hypothetical protein